MDYLSAAIAYKKKELGKILPIEGKLRAAAIQRNEYAGFRSCLDLGTSRLSVVAEIARKTPLSPEEAEFDPSKLTERMHQGRAQCVSLVTESLFCGGSFSDLSRLSQTSPIPILARDLWLHPAEICRAIVGGADAINLIAGAMPASDLEYLYSMATGLGLDVMVEVHSLQEMETALDLDPELICINHRDLHTLELDLNLTEKLIEEIPHHVTVLSAGGINDEHIAMRMLEAGSNGVILGQPLMKADIPQELISSILALGINEE